MIYPLRSPSSGPRRAGCRKGGYLLLALAGVLWLAGGSSPAPATEVPFVQRQTIATQSGSTHALFAADVDGDGDPDLVAATGLGGVAWWENPGTGSSWPKHLVRQMFATDIVAVDMDQDGDMDILAPTLVAGPGIV